MVFQSYALYPHKTVAENMGFALLLRKDPKAEIEKRVRRAAEILDLVPLLERYRANSRAASASAWPWAAPSCATRPCSCSTNRSPTSMPSSVCRCERRSRNCTSAQDDDRHVTHDQVEAMTMADRIVVLHDGIVDRPARRSTFTTRPQTFSSQASSARPP